MLASAIYAISARWRVGGKTWAGGGRGWRLHACIRVPDALVGGGPTVIYM